MPKNADIEKKEEYRKQQKATLRMLQSLPLGDKIRITQELIDEAILKYDENHTYLSFSGGKDSTVLSHNARIRYPNILRAFCDISCEYPETIAFVHGCCHSLNLNLICVELYTSPKRSCT